MKKTLYMAFFTNPDSQESDYCAFVAEIESQVSFETAAKEIERQFDIKVEEDDIQSVESMHVADLLGGGPLQDIIAVDRE